MEKLTLKKKLLKKEMTQEKLLPPRLERQVNKGNHSFLGPEKKTVSTSCGLLVMLLPQGKCITCNRCSI